MPGSAPQGACGIHTGLCRSVARPPDQHTRVRDGIRLASGRASAGMEAVWRPQMDRRGLEIRIRKPTLTVRPDWLREPRTAANTGEYPRKRWTSGERVRLCSRLFVVLETAKGPQRAPKGTAKGPQSSASRCATIAAMGESPEIDLVRRAWDGLIAVARRSWPKCWRPKRSGTAWRTGSSAMAARQSST